MQSENTKSKELLLRYGRRYDFPTIDKRGGTQLWDARVDAMVTLSTIHLFSLGQSFTGLESLRTNTQSPAPPKGEVFVVTSIDENVAVVHLDRMVVA